MSSLFSLGICSICKTQNQVNSLQDRISDLETKLTFEENSKYALSRTLKASEATKILKQGDSPSKVEKGASFDRLDLNQEKGLSEANFRPLKKIPEEKLIEIIQTGFRLNQEGKISLKKYYESTDAYSLFQSKGYKIKYESIRRTKLYQQLKFQL